MAAKEAVETIKGLVLVGFGGYEKIKLADIPKPSAKEDHIVVEIKACGMNFADLYTRQGIYTFHGVKPPFVLGMEGSGVISEVGANVSEFKVGDKVFCWNFRYGMYAEYVLLHKSQCHAIPERMTFLEANCLVANYLTAYMVLMDFGNLRPDQSVLIQAAAGGLGWAATQIAKSVKNVKVFGTASASKHNIIKENGVNHPIDYVHCDFVEEVENLSPSGVNIILDTRSGNDFVRAQKLLAPMGRIIHVGISSMISGEKRNLWKNVKVWIQTRNIGTYDLVDKNRAVCGFNIATVFEDDPKLFHSSLKEVINLFNDGKIKPRVDSVWGFDQVIEATKCIVERKNIGKVILVPRKEDAMEKIQTFQN